MTIAVTFGNLGDKNSLSGAFYFSAVTKYDRQFKGKVTEHPIEAGSEITDHFISENPVYRVSGVVSSVDFTNIPTYLNLDGQAPINDQPMPNPVYVSNMGHQLQALIPDVVGQFLPNLPTANVNIQMEHRENKRDEIEDLLKEILTGLFYNEERARWENRMTLSKLFMIEGVTPNPPIEDLVLTEVSVSEDENSGDELFLDLTFEQVKFVTLESADAPSPPKGSATAKKTEPEKNVGNVPATTTPTPKSGNTRTSAGRAVGNVISGQ